MAAVPVKAGQAPSPGNFSYSIEVSAAPVSQSLPTPTLSTFELTQDSASIRLTGYNGSLLSSLAPGTDIGLGEISVGRDTTGLSQLALDYDFRLEITDESRSTPVRGFVDLLGTLGGMVRRTDSGAEGFDVTNTFLGSVQSIKLNNDTYMIVADAYTPPSFFPGQFGANVSVALPALGTLSITPEPATGCLALIGAASFLLLLNSRRPSNPSSS